MLGRSLWALLGGITFGLKNLDGLKTDVHSNFERVSGVCLGGSQKFWYTLLSRLVLCKLSSEYVQIYQFYLKILTSIVSNRGDNK